MAESKKRKFCSEKNKKISFLLPIYVNLVYLGQGIGIKGKEMALVWHEKASRTVFLTHTLLVQTCTT